MDWTLDQKVAAQQRLLGTSLEAHPLELFAAQIHACGAITTAAAASRVGEKVVVAGMRQNLHRSLTASHQWMAFLTLEDLEGLLDVVIFPDVYQRARSALASSAHPLIIEGTIERAEASGEPVLQASKVWNLKND